MPDFDFESLTHQHFDDNYSPGRHSDTLAAKTVFGGDPKERYRQVSLKRMLDQLNGRAPAPLPTFPNGWFDIGFADELALRQVRPLNLFGQDVVLYRGRGGDAHLLDAHCPHLGAHLGHGGKVAGDDLVCPFHAWRFDGRGSCMNVPYSDEFRGCERSGLASARAKRSCVPMLPRRGRGPRLGDQRAAAILGSRDAHRGLSLHAFHGEYPGRPREWR
ncbi:MAG: Rieske 2Fe-2S domain-containing protein, partial [Deltaproteobacteria bacterium]|nr:Rieske 2Fe-2S domain-containing protein [Deltaproteobacteria bacterium]